MCTVPVTRKSSASSRGSASRLPRRSAAANGACDGDTCACSTSLPWRRTVSSTAGGHHHGGSHVGRRQAGDSTRTIERHRLDRARARKSNSSGLKAGAGRSPRPSTTSRVPTRRAGGGPSMTSAARPAADCQRLPSRTACTTTTLSLDGPRAPACPTAAAGGGRSRGDSSTVHSIATGCGDSVRLQARSATGKRSCCAVDQAAPAAMTAVQSQPAAAPRPRVSRQPAMAAPAPHHQMRADFEPNGSGTSRPTAQPAPRQTAITTSGRQGSGSLRQALRMLHHTSRAATLPRRHPSRTPCQMFSTMTASPGATLDADGRRARQVNNERGGTEGQKNSRLLRNLREFATTPGAVVHMLRMWTTVKTPQTRATSLQVRQPPAK
jgi:hypothetical protein